MRVGAGICLRISAGVAVGIAVVCTFAPSVLAQPGGEPIAKPIVDDAVAQYSLGHFSEAAALFEKAYQVDPAPILLFNIGQCHRRLGNNELALFFYRQYLDQAPPNARERPDVVKRVADLERSLREQADLKDKPPPGVAREVPPAGSAPILPAQPIGELSGTMGPPAPVQSPGTAPAAEDAGSQRRVPTLAWVTGGLGAASLILGVVEAVAWSSRASRFNDHTGPTANDPVGSSRNCGVDEPNRGGSGCAALYDDVSSARTLAVIGLVGGGGLVATSLILLLTSKPRPTTDAFVGLGCGPNLYSMGLTCRLSF